MKNIVAASHRSIRRGAGLIRAGELVAFPTETVYGLGANALDARAVAKIFEAKRRPRFNPLIVHVAAREDALRLWRCVPANAGRLMDLFWPGPLTIVLPKSDAVPDVVTAGLATVAVRIPAHPVALELLRLARRPIAAPSANMFGRPSPTTARAVAEDLAGKASLILDAGDCPVGVESTVVSLTGKTATVLRLGGTPFEELKRVLGSRVKLKIATKSKMPRAPGMLERHYAPAKPLFIVRTLPPPRRSRMKRRTVVRPLERAAFLAFTDTCENKAFSGIVQGRDKSAPSTSSGQALSLPKGEGAVRLPFARAAARSRSRLGFGIEPCLFSAVEVLSASGDVTEAAANYFAALRRLSSTMADFILAQEVPESGLGCAIMDRLRRAAAGTAVIDWKARSATLFTR